MKLSPDIFLDTLIVKANPKCFFQCLDIFSEYNSITVNPSSNSKLTLLFTNNNNAYINVKFSDIVSLQELKNIFPNYTFKFMNFVP